MKRAIATSLILTLSLCIGQANAAIIYFTEDKLTVDLSVWFFDAPSPPFPSNSPGNTIVAEQHRQYNGAMLEQEGRSGHSFMPRIETWLEGGSGAAGAYVNAIFTESDNSFGAFLRSKVINDDTDARSYGTAAWDLEWRFTVEGDDASLNLGWEGVSLGDLIAPPWWDESFESMSLALFNETTATSLVSLPNWGVSTGCEFGCEILLEDGNEYTLTTTGYRMSRAYADNEPELWISFNNARYVPVPEPSTAVLMLLGLAGIASLRYRRKS